MFELDKLIETYEEMVNETNEARQRAAARAALAHGFRFVGPKGGEVAGADAMIDFVRTLRDQAPADHMRIRRTTPIDTHNGWLRFGWEFVDDDERILGEGMSVGRVADDGRLARLVAFFDQLQPDQVLSAMHRAFNDRDADTIRGLLAEDVVWHIPGNHPMAGTYRGRDEVWERFLSPMWHTPARIEDHAVLKHPQHNHVAVLLDVIHDFGEGEQRIRGSEIAQIRDGQVAERWAVDEDQEMVDRLITQAMRGEVSTPSA